MQNIKALLQVKAFSYIPEFVPFHGNILTISIGIIMEKHAQKDSIPNFRKKFADGTVSLAIFFNILFIQVLIELLSCVHT